MVDVDGGRHPPLKFFFLEINLCRVPQLNTQKIKMPHHVLSPSYVREATFFSEVSLVDMRQRLSRVSEKYTWQSRFANEDFFELC
jgi:hypothetical protein